MWLPPTFADAEAVGAGSVPPMSVTPTLDPDGTLGGGRFLDEASVKVRVLLDVDGVLNAVYARAPFAWDDFVEDHANRFLITYSPTVARFISALAADVEVQWLTTWAELANKFISPMLGLPDFEVAGTPDWDADGWWKLGIAQQLWERDHMPFVWLDDDITFEAEALAWLATLEGGKDYLAISSLVDEGLRPEHLDQITAFIKERSAEQ